MPKGIPLTEEEQTRRRKEIFEAAVHLFVDNGFNETSMRQIAEAAGIGKSTLYDYFTTKDEMLVSYFEDELAGIHGRAIQIKNQNIATIEKLRQITLVHLEYMLTNKNLYFKLSFEAQRLAFESQQRIQVQRHAYQDLLRSILDDGIAEGVFRPVDTTLAVRMLFAALTPVVFTTRPSGTPQEMLEKAFEIFLRGVQV